MNECLSFLPEVSLAAAAGTPVVALESTILSHGMPYPQNLEFAHEVENVIRAEGAVPATIRGNFFEKFSTAGKKDGTGLGTYGARLIAETHGARITMATSEARGTTVTVSFPRPRLPAERPQSAPQAAQSPAKTGS